MSRHILIMVTSTDRMPSGQPTGLWLEEFAVPYLIFKKAGYEITVASPKGDNTPIDARSAEDAKSHPDWAAASDVLKSMRKLDDKFRAKDFDAVFFPGARPAATTWMERHDGFLWWQAGRDAVWPGRYPGLPRP